MGYPQPDRETQERLGEYLERMNPLLAEYAACLKNLLELYEAEHAQNRPAV